MVALTVTLVLSLKVMLLEKKKKVNDYKKDEKEFKKPKLFKIWNFLIYGSYIAIGVS